MCISIGTAESETESYLYTCKFLARKLYNTHSPGKVLYRAAAGEKTLALLSSRLLKEPGAAQSRRSCCCCCSCIEHLSARLLIQQHNSGTCAAASTVISPVYYIYIFANTIYCFAMCDAYICGSLASTYMDVTSSAL